MDPLATSAELRRNWAAVKRGEVFNSLNTQPEDWNYVGGCQHVFQEMQCQLCETMINYRFPLRAPSKTGEQTLLVGRECVVNFYEAYFPNGLDVVLNLLEGSFESTRKEVITEKIAEFRTRYPKLVEFLLDSKDSKKREFRRVTVPDPPPLRSNSLVSTAVFRAILKRRGYLKPAEIERLLPNVKAWLDSLKSCPLCGRTRAQHLQGICPGPITGWGEVP